MNRVRIRESHRLSISARYIQPEDTIRQNTGTTDGAFGGGGHLRHYTPVVNGEYQNTAPRSSKE